MNVIDSSGWLEHFLNGPNAAAFREPLAKPNLLLVPTITIYETFKKIASRLGEASALAAVAHMRIGQAIELSEALAMAAARLSIDLSLPLADAVILATARAHGATLWTQDADFEGMEGVRYVARGE